MSKSMESSDYCVIRISCRDKGYCVFDRVFYAYIVWIFEGILLLPESMGHCARWKMPLCRYVMMAHSAWSSSAPVYWGFKGQTRFGAKKP